jgi:hypothetical protein
MAESCFVDPQEGFYDKFYHYFQHFPKTMFSQYEGNPDRLFNAAFAVKYSAKKMKK